MRKYEIIYILDSSIGEEKIKELVEKFSEFIGTKGTVENVEEWGNRKLAYEIKKKTEGYYVVVNCEASVDMPAALERQFQITEDVLKYLIVSNEEK